MSFIDDILDFAGQAGDRVFTPQNALNTILGATTGGAGGFPFDEGTGAFDLFGSASAPGSNQTIFGGTLDNPFGSGGFDLGGIFNGVSNFLGGNNGMNGRILGALGGGILGALGGAKVGGYTNTTQRQDRNLTDRSSLPSWQEDMIRRGLSRGFGLLNVQANQGTPALLGPATAQMNRTIQGDYLTPASNPALRQWGAAVADDTMRPITSAFEGAGRYGSPAFASTAAHEISKNLSALYGDAYQNERRNQMLATGGAPQFSAASFAVPWAPFNNFMQNARGDFGRTVSSTGNTTGKLTAPWFTNRAGGILSGAAVGSQLFGRG